MTRYQKIATATGCKTSFSTESAMNRRSPKASIGHSSVGSTQEAAVEPVTFKVA
jgi:hypothetical protein